MSTVTTEVLEIGVAVDDGGEPAPDLTEAEQASLAESKGDAKDAKLAEIMARSTDNVAKKMINAYDGDDALGRHIAAGKAVHDHMIKVKTKILKAWRKRDYDDLATQIENKIARTSVVRAKCYDDHRAYLFLEAFKVSAPGVESLKWGHVLHHFSTLIVLNKTDLDYEVRKGWFTFVQEYVARPDAPTKDECAELFKAHEKKLIDAADAELSEQDRAKKIAERARAEKTRKVKAATGQVREAAKKALEVIDTPLQVVQALDEAGMVFDPNGIAALMQTALTDCKPDEMVKAISQRGITLPVPSPYDPATMTIAGAKAFTIALRDAGNWNAILTLYKALSELVAQMKETAAPATLAATG